MIHDPRNESCPQNAKPHLQCTCAKRPYTSPVLRELGTVAELTKGVTGCVSDVGAEQPAGT